ncbi:MAG: transposase [Myxococcales bacterium]|nr:transposase [Myxococcales bacterium]
MARGLVGSALARAQKHCEVKVYALVVMSNHLHLIVRTTKKNLAAFMGYFKARITENLNLLTGKRGTLWARRYDAVPITDDPSVAERMAYNVDNPCKANLVSEPEQWPGLNLAFGLGDSDGPEFEWLNRTKWHRKKRPEKLAPFFEKVTLKLSPVPACEGMDRELCPASLERWLEHQRAKQSAKGNQRSAAPMGVEKVVQTSFEARPKNPSFSKRPYVFCQPEHKAEYLAGLMAISQGHHDCSKRFRGGQRDAKFPEGTYPPPLMQAA